MPSLSAACASCDERQYLASVIESTGVGTWEWHVPSHRLRFEASFSGALVCMNNRLSAA